ncbi:MAG: HDOD domain-containing protein [Rhodoferax sp.]
MSGLDAFFATVKLPTISEVGHQLIRSLNQDEPDLARVSALIARDPALAAQLLRLANSAEFGLPRRVNALDDAIHLVGMAKVRSLAVAASVGSAFGALPGLDAHAFWRYCMACAGYAQWMAAALDMDAQQAWLTGMMLRLGEVLIAQTRPEIMPALHAQPCLPGERWLRQHRLLGFAEGQITAELARRWNFPMQIVQGLQRSYDPLVEQAFSRLGAVVHLAGLLADSEQPSAESVAHLPSDVVAELVLEPDWLAQTLPDPARFVKLYD